MTDAFFLPKFDLHNDVSNILKKRKKEGYLMLVSKQQKMGPYSDPYQKIKEKYELHIKERQERQEFYKRMVMEKRMENIKKAEFSHFLDIHFGQKNDLYSFVTIGCRYNTPKSDQAAKDEFWKKVQEKKAEGKYYYGKIKHKIFNFFTFRTDSEYSVANIPDNMFDPRNVNEYFIRANGFKHFHDNCAQNLFTLYNIVIDIDCHNPRMLGRTYYFDLLENGLVEFFEGSDDVPTPNTLVRTGRGFQLWWAITPLSYKKLRKPYNLGVERLCQIISKFLIDHKFYDFKVDKIASQRPSGYFRVPGTFNRNVGAWGSFSIFHEDQLNLLNWVNDGKVIRSTKKKKHAKKIISVEETGRRKKDYFRNVFDSRIDAVYHLYKLRGDIKEGYRDIFCFVLMNLLQIRLSPEEAFEVVRKFNQDLKNPLRERELKTYMGSSMRKKYTLTNKKIIQLLDITPEEQDIINLHVAKVKKGPTVYTKKYRPYKTKEQKTEVIEKFKEGMTQRQIAKETGISQSTVCRIIQEWRGITPSIKKSDKGTSVSKKTTNTPTKKLTKTSMPENKTDKTSKSKTGKTNKPKKKKKTKLINVWTNLPYFVIFVKKYIPRLLFRDSKNMLLSMGS